MSSIEAAQQAGEAAAEASVKAGLAVAAVTSDVGLKRDQQSPCSVEEDSGPTSADLVMSSTYGKVRELFFYCLGFFVLYIFMVCILYTRCLLRFEYQLPHLILCTTLATDKNDPCHFNISYQNSEIS